MGLDLRVFAPRAGTASSRWRHIIRRFDGRGRLPLPELSDLAVAHDGGVAATLARDRWELRPATWGPSTVVLDGRRRVLVPLGVRHQLGFAAGCGALVSLALDGSLLVVGPVECLDALVEQR